MKKSFLMMSLVLGLLVSVFALTACSSDDNDTGADGGGGTSSLAGMVWRCTNSNNYVTTVTMLTDTKLHIKQVSPTGAVTIDEEHGYSYNAATHTVTVQYGDGYISAVISGNTMTCIIDGETWVFERIDNNTDDGGTSSLVGTVWSYRNNYYVTTVTVLTDTKFHVKQVSLTGEVTIDAECEYSYDAANHTVKSQYGDSYVSGNIMVCIVNGEPEALVFVRIDDGNTDDSGTSSLVGTVWSYTDNYYVTTVTVLTDTKFHVKQVSPTGEATIDEECEYSYDAANHIVKSQYGNSYVSGNIMACVVDGEPNPLVFVRIDGNDGDGSTSSLVGTEWSNINSYYVTTITVLTDTKLHIKQVSPTGEATIDVDNEYSYDAANHIVTAQYGKGYVSGNIMVCIIDGETLIFVRVK